MTQISPADQERSRDGVFEMFDRIAPRYDFLNRVLSGGIDVWWRSQLVSTLASHTGQHILDLATGTGDLLVAMAKDRRVDRVLGVDVSAGMIEAGKHKLEPLSHAGKDVDMVVGDAMKLEEYVGQFDAVTISFGIRNVVDVDLALRQMRNALKPGGKVLILEFSTPGNPVVAPAYNFYRSRVLPKVGGWISGDKDAYHYLDETIATFPSGDAFVSKMRAAGLVRCTARPMTFGVVTLYEGHREDA